MSETLFPLKLLVDADAWQIWGQNETYFLYFLSPHPPFKKTFLTPLHAASINPPIQVPTQNCSFLISSR